MTLGEKLNNPLNIRYKSGNHWFGQTGHEDGFVRFKNYIYGVRAAAVILRTYRLYGYVTVEQIINRWAPPSENDTEAYINFVCKQTGMKRNTMVDSEPFITGLICAMIRIETGMKISTETVSNIVKAAGV